MVEVLYGLIKETEEGDTIQLRILKVKKDAKYPEGIRYRLALIHDEKRVLGYDNTYPEGHHKHVVKDNKEVKVSCKFVDAETLLRSFKTDVEKWRNEQYGTDYKK